MRADHLDMPTAPRRPFVALTGLLAGCAVAAPAASAATVPRDGVWAGTVTSTACDQAGCAPTDELGYFKLRSRTASAMSYTVLIACYNRETRETYDRYFTGGAAFPRRARVPGGLVLTKSYRERSDGRSGTVTTTLDFRGSRAKLKVRMSVGGTIERCTGRTTIPLRRGTPLAPR